jgi:hypothetical protein
MYIEIGDGLSIALDPYRLSTWNSAGRPTGIEGSFGYNIELEQLEIYTSSAWMKVSFTSL